MNWVIDFSNESDKFLKRNHIKDSEIISYFSNVIKKFNGEDINADIVKKKGEWIGFYRLRIGKKRIIFSVDFDSEKIFVDKIDFRGDVYK